MTAAHVLQGGPMEGKVIMMTSGQGNYPAALRILEEPEAKVTDPIVIHVYAINRGHQADVRRPVRPTYHYTHTTTI